MFILRLVVCWSIQKQIGELLAEKKVYEAKLGWQKNMAKSKQKWDHQTNTNSVKIQPRKIWTNTCQ